MIVLRFQRRLLCFFVCCCCSLHVIGASYAERAEVRAFIAEMVARHRFQTPELEALFSGVERQQGIIDTISKPVERTLEWKDYRKLLITPERIEGGRQFLAANAALLERVGEKWGVPPAVIVAILGVETRYGQVQGRHVALEALSTLAFDYPPRARFFRGELEQLLLLGREQGLDLSTLRSSYAGALGYGQFMPSSYRHFAVDFDDDHRADLIGSVADAVGSVASYLARHGWEKDAAIAWLVQPTSTPPADLLPGNQKPRHRLRDFSALGLDTRGLQDRTPARLLAVHGEQGREYWLGLQNFYVITRYNHSDLYALAVVQLSEAIARP